MAEKWEMCVACAFKEVRTGTNPTLFASISPPPPHLMSIKAHQSRPPDEFLSVAGQNV